MAHNARIRLLNSVAMRLRVAALATAAALAFALAAAMATPMQAYAAYDNYSTSTIAWGLGVNYNHTSPSGPVSSSLLAKYDAYYVGNTSKQNKRMYLSFDCGYENGQTPGILDTLKKTGVKAVFFVTADFINAEPGLVKRMKKEGHLVGNHTVHHPHMAQMSPADVKAELRNNEKLMKQKTGYDMDKIWRPPYGEASERTMRVAQSMGYLTIFWSMAYYDYDPSAQPGKDYVVGYFNDHHHPGAITLTHNVSSSNREALGTVIKNMKRKGYQFALLSDLKLSKPDRAELKSVVSEKPRRLKVTYKKLKGATGYEVQIARNAKFTKDVQTVERAKTYKTFKKLKQGWKYYVRVRGYTQTSIETLYGKWSKKQSVVVMRKPKPAPAPEPDTGSAAEGELAAGEPAA